VVKPGPNDPCWCQSGKKYKICHRHVDMREALGGVRSAVGAPKVEPMPGFRPVLPMPSKLPLRPVPNNIIRPPYAETGLVPHVREHGVEIKSPEQIQRMRKACRLAREVIEVAKRAVRPGITTDDIDAITHQAYIDRGGYPSTLNYHHYPKSLCTSVNEVICHGIPDLRPLVEGDIVNLDITIYIDGMHGDMSETVAVGAIDAESQRLIDTTRTCMMAGINAVRPGGMMRDIGRAIQDIAKPQGFGVVRRFVGHGIGSQFHMAPQVPHYYDAGATTVFAPGMVFTIEPMINQGVPDHVTWDDHWTAVTADLKRSAQFEHTILVTPTGVEILTA